MTRICSRCACLLARANTTKRRRASAESEAARGIWSPITGVGVVFTGKREWCVVKEGILSVSILHVLRRHPVETEVPFAGVICRRDPSAVMTGAVPLMSAIGELTGFLNRESNASRST
jgi:hypothetical protein